MKKFFKYILLGMPLLLAGCSDDDVRFDIETPADTMHLSASSQSIELKHYESDQPAVTFTWQNAAPREGADKIAYYFKMDIADNDFESAIAKIEVTGNSISFTHKQLNDMLSDWGITPGTAVDLEAELIAQPEETAKYMKPELSTARITVTGYSVQLFIAGSATAAGDNVANAISLNEIVAAQQYTWTGYLKPGNFYFPMSREENLGAYGRGTDDNHLAFSETGDVTPFEITHEGFYTLTLNIDALTITYEERVWMVGEATPNGWDLLKATELTRQAGTRIFKWKGVLNRGQLKFPLKVDEAVWNGPFLLADSDNTPAEGTSAINFVEHCSDAVDFKWYVSEMAIYQITVDLDKKTVTFDKESLDLPWSEIWIVGDATPGGWNSDPFQIKMTYDYTAARGTFVWEGELTAGELKFPLHERTFEGAYLMAPYADAPLTETTVVYSSDGNPDNKWRVQPVEAGLYKISVNVIDMTVKFEKQD